MLIRSPSFVAVIRINSNDEKGSLVLLVYTMPLPDNHALAYAVTVNELTFREYRYQ